MLSCFTLILFYDTAHREEWALKSLSDHQLPALVKLLTSHLETLQSWAIIHHGYSLLHAGLQQEAAVLVDKVSATRMNPSCLLCHINWVSKVIRDCFVF